MRPQPIQYDTDTWLIMREDPSQPKAVVKRVRNRSNFAQFLLMTWDPDPGKWRLDSMHQSLEYADRAVPIDNTEMMRKAYANVPDVRDATYQGGYTG